MDTSGKEGAADSNIQQIQEPNTASPSTTQRTNVQELQIDISEKKGDADKIPNKIKKLILFHHQQLKEKR